MSVHPLASLNVLRAFDAAARHRSFAAAAEELHVTASAVSQQVRTLERHVGTPLFERHPRSVELTPAGAAYADELRPHLRAIDRATDAVRSGGGPRRLRVTAAPPIASRVIVPQLAGFQAAHPGVSVHVHSSLQPVDLRQRTADVALRFGAPPWDGCVHERLLDVYAQPVCAPALAAAAPAAALPPVLSLPLVHMTERGDLWSRYFDEAGLGSPSPPEEFHVDEYPAAIEAAETIGAALALLPIERPLLESGRVVAVGPVVGPLDEGLYAVIREDDREDLDIAAFVAWLRDRLSDLG